MSQSTSDSIVVAAVDPIPSPILVDVVEDRDEKYEEFLRSTATPMLPEPNEASATKEQVDTVIDRLDSMLMRYEKQCLYYKRRTSEMCTAMIELVARMQELDRGQTAILKRLNLLESCMPTKRFETEMLGDEEEEGTSQPLPKRPKLD